MSIISSHSPTRTQKLKTLSGVWLVLASASATNIVTADTPLGWLNNNNMSAYTATRGELELSGSFQRVNDTIDFLNIREDLFANNQRLVGKSGDLSGARYEAHYGITDYLSVFARYQQHELTVDLGDIASVNIVDISPSLDTTQKEVGIKWMLYEADLLNPDNRQTALSLQISGTRNETDDFDVFIDRIDFSNFTVFFTDPTAFSVDEMEDEGWSGRLLYSTALENLGVGSLWAGYGESSGTSGTSTNAINGTVRNLFAQSFELEESYFYLGASINFSLRPRIRASLSYEFIDIAESKFSREPLTPSSQLPSFLSVNGLADEDRNHTLSARLSYWLTPEINASISGQLYSNQFLGRLPHYNNPLGESFASVPYGFIGAELAYKF
ncbi:MAG: hypothetical protein DHS20C12_25540 [Pseudohongiella sp.]|nr:MAG: hypothetical protein DHS20C12_25540 [Pseudohongiella sp.]